MITQLHGDCLELLETLPAESVQTVVTSPPYWQLRKYTDDPREIGREATPAAYVAALVAVFRACRRVLRRDGTLWVNIGDSYGHGTTAPGKRNKRDGYDKGATARSDHDNMRNGLPAKQLMGMPWRVAFALQDDGWILRSDIIWSKPNCMPESVTDRPTRSHEYVFLFSKSRRYYYDAAAIAEAASPASTPSTRQYNKSNETDPNRLRRDLTRLGGGSVGDGVTRNARSVWTIATQPLADEHYAAMPVALADRCIRAGSSAQACETCGAAWGRVVERESDVVNLEEGQKQAMRSAGVRTGGTQKVTLGVTEHVKRIDLGFAPRCRCAVNAGAGRSTVLDPFAGSGTTLRAAVALSRDAIGIDLAYQDMQERRTNGVQIELL